jgi:predicted nucleotidyltransferase
MYDAIDKAILFGLHARGDQRPGSDCDIITTKEIKNEQLKR